MAHEILQPSPWYCLSDPSAVLGWPCAAHSTRWGWVLGCAAGEQLARAGLGQAACWAGKKGTA